MLELSWSEGMGTAGLRAPGGVEHPIHLFPGRSTGNERLEQPVPGRRPRLNEGSGGTLAPALGPRQSWKGESPSAPLVCGSGLGDCLGTAPVQPAVK